MRFATANHTDHDRVNDRPLAVVIVTYNSANTLCGLLDTLADGLRGIARTEIVVVDNASADNSVAIVRKHPVGARVVQTGRNGGYAAGINAAVATIDNDADLLVLNPDIRLSPGVAALLVAPLREASVAITVPKMLHEDGTLFHSLRREPSLQTAWADALLGTRLGYGLDRGECVCADSRYETNDVVDWASGAALAVSARARAEIGDWDESFFLYSEEVDYQRRARAAGFHIVYVPQARVVHIGGEYSRNAQLYSILTANRVRDYARHHSAFSTLQFRLAVLTGEALRSVGGSPVHRAGAKAALQFRERRPASFIPKANNA
ncbi:glycosyltransferase family 2 protein [Devosia sp. 2618]|uniref:glycosyltransferase family 2 protein n=1 Tax=Devosia sp. 2618 TaxID=3156454 RepID=UPI0033953DD1